MRQRESVELALLSSCSRPRRPVAKRGARGISIDEAQQVPRNPHVIVRNPVRCRGGATSADRRTDGGRGPLTLVIGPTIDPTTWLLVTGW